VHARSADGFRGFGLDHGATIPPRARYCPSTGHPSASHVRLRMASVGSPPLAPS
jgi:hypothetical protein